MAPRIKVSMETIANALGVSKVTVSKALNDKEGVSEELREIIKAKAIELGYHININARGLKSNKTFNIGIIISERYISETNNYYFSVYAKLVRALSLYGLTGIMEIIDKEKEENLVLPTVYHERKVDALIILGECKKQYLSLYEDFDIPVIFFDFKDEDIKVDSILVDNYSSGNSITKLLINNGHKKIGFIGNIYSTSSIKDRYLGYYRALLEAGIELNPNYVISDRDNNGQFIDIKFPTDMPTAFVCNYDQLAYTVIKKFEELGYNVPNDISVVAFDNTIYSKLSDVQITTVDTNVDEMVNIAAKVINKKLTKPGKVYDEILVKGKIVMGGSVKNIKEI